jgi:hypothetical protein
MPPAWHRALTYRVTVKRQSTQVSASGVSTFVYTMVAEDVACSLQDAGGRQTQDDVGQTPSRKKRVIFDYVAAAGIVLQGDLLVLENVDVGQTYRVTHTHTVNHPNAPHIEADAEAWAPGGGD